MQSLLVHPNKFLRKRSRDVAVFDQATLDLVENMKQCLLSTNGAGMSAIQIGVPLRVVVLSCLDGGTITMVNPAIVKASGRVAAKERCLSLKGGPFWVQRYTRLELTHLRGNALVTMNVDDPQLAVAIQHEIDHLNGVLLCDRSPTFAAAN